MSEPARPEPAKKPKPEATKKSSAPRPKPGSPAKPALAKLRRALGELIAAHRAGSTHMVPLYAANLRSSLDAALQVRGKATDTERAELADLETRSRKLLATPTPAAGTSSADDIAGPGDLQIDWDLVSDSIDQIAPGVGPAVTKAPQVYRDVFEAVTRSPLHMSTVFKEQWELIRDHWPEFLATTAAFFAAEVAVFVLAASPEPVVTKIAAVVLQGLIAAFAIHAAVSMTEEAAAYAQAFWMNAEAANGDVRMLDAAALNFARLVVAMIKSIVAVVGAAKLVQRALTVPHAPEPSKTTKSDQPTKATEPKPHAGESRGKSQGEPGRARPSESTGASSTAKPRVTEPVKGVWEQGEAPRFHQPKFAHLEVHETPVLHEPNGIRSVKTYVLDGTKENSLLGWAERAYDPATNTVILRNAFLDELPSKIKPSKGGMLTPDGTPTQTYITLRQMKALGVQYGEVKKFKMSTIQNIRSVIELEVLRKQMPMDEAVSKTYSITYAQTPITQSGHRIVGVKYVKAATITDKLQFLMEHYEHDHSTGKPIQTKVDAHNKLIETYGKGLVTRDTVLDYNYDIELTVEPISPRTP